MTLGTARVWWVAMLLLTAPGAAVAAPHAMGRVGCSVSLYDRFDDAFIPIPPGSRAHTVHEIGIRPMLGLRVVGSDRFATAGVEFRAAKAPGVAVFDPAGERFTRVEQDFLEFGWLIGFGLQRQRWAAEARLHHAYVANAVEFQVRDQLIEGPILFLERETARSTRIRLSLLVSTDVGPLSIGVEPGIVVASNAFAGFSSTLGTLSVEGPSPHPYIALTFEVDLARLVAGSREHSIPR